MPELPEVETIVRNLRPIFEGRKFLGGEAFNASSFVSEEFSFEDLAGKKLISIERRGKFINMFFEDEFVLTVHLRMTGRLIVIEEGGEGEEGENPQKYERVRLHLKGMSLGFHDLRKFGKVWLNKGGDYEEKTGIGRLGIEPMRREFDLKNFEALLASRKGNVKAFLLDQSRVAGIGNIYADEALFYAGIRPHRDLKSLREDEKKKLFEGVKCSLSQGIENCGTSFSDFVNAHGEKGSNQELLFVYGRGGKKCLRCGGILKKEKVAGRGTVYCEECQE